MNRFAAAFSCVLCALFTFFAPPAFSVSMEETNTCLTTTDDPCLRTGTCSIQGADWFQEVHIDRNDIFATQGWPGLCDMVHVALVQGNCEPPGAQTDVTAYLSVTTFAQIPSILGPLACAGTAAPPAGAVPNGHTVPGAPLLLVRDSVGDLILTWGISCSSGDDDYIIYEGSISEGFASHAPRTCSTNRLTSAVLEPGGGDHYYLVVPRNESREGAQGR
jgi:hypothetical protein